jgi:hypothetical protein
MYVTSECELPVASMIWQPQRAAWTLTVICRATFRLLPGESLLLPGSEQEAPYEHDDHWNDDEDRSLRVASDLVPLKPRADVTLIGHAFAPDGVPVRSLVTRLVIGEVDKSVEVFADRAFDQEGTLHEGPRFTSMPLLYERAAGGPGTANPVGVRGVPDARGRIAAPNLHHPGTQVSSASSPVAPTGFGPLAPEWPGRREMRGPGPALSLEDMLQKPLPADLDASYYNHAPCDQQLQLLRDNERFVLENLHPEHPCFATALPGVRPRAIVEQKGTTEVVPLRCDTLWIDTDQQICALTWRLQIPLEHPEQAGRVTVTLNAPPAAPALTLDDADVGPITVKPHRGPAGTMPFLPDGSMPLADALPFVPSALGGPAPRVEAEVFQTGSWPVVESPAGASAEGSPAPATSAEPAQDLAPARSGEVKLVSKVELGRALHLVWFDPECLPRLRRKHAFRPILERLDGRGLDADLDDPALAKDPMVVEDRRDVFEVLAHGDVDDEAALQEAMERALREDGKFVAPLELTAGELRFPFDELEALRATLSIAGALAAGDEPLEAAIAEGRQYLGTPDLLSPPDVTEGFTTRVVEAFRKARRAVSPAYVEEQAERVLLEKRHYQRREVFGGPHLRGLLYLGTSPRPWPAYVPAAATAKLPLFARFPVRLLADACLQEDQYEPHPAALRVVALARTAPAPIRGERMGREG